MYISLESCECNYPTPTPYKEFPTDILLENIAYLLSNHPTIELSPLKELESMRRYANKNDRAQILINYIHKHGTQNPDDLMTTEIDINDDHGYYRFHLAYNKSNFYHYCYSNTHEEDWESQITHHEKFEDEDN
jgi:hypothetical protein